MPHKHKRKRDDEGSDFNLPPTSRARTLSVHQKSASLFSDDAARKEKFADKKRRKHGKAGTGQQLDDTPKAFLRLMAMQQGRKIKSGLDDGVRDKKSKKNKKEQKKSNAQVSSGEQGSAAQDKRPSVSRDDKKQSNISQESSAAAASTTSEALQQDPSPPPPTNTTTTAPLTILPNERLSDFSRRVDQSLPLSSIPKSSGNRGNLPGAAIKTPLTKHNKRLSRLIRDWRTRDAKLKAQREDLADEQAEQREEDSLLWLGVGANGGAGAAAAAGGKSAKGKKLRRRELDDQLDPWKGLVKKRAAEERERRLNGGGGGDVVDVNGRGKGLSARDTVQAPPVLKPVKNIFKKYAEDKDQRAVVERSVMT